jgi:hypothetical protein
MTTATKSNYSQGRYDAIHGSRRASDDAAYRQGYAAGLKRRVRGERKPRSRWEPTAPPNDMRSRYRVTADRACSVDLEGIATIPDDCDKALRFAGHLDEEQEERCKAAIEAACKEIQRRVYVRKLESVVEVDDGDDDE